MEKSMNSFAALFSVSEADVTQGHHSIGKKIHMIPKQQITLEHHYSHIG